MVLMVEDEGSRAGVFLLRVSVHPVCLLVGTAVCLSLQPDLSPISSAGGKSDLPPGGALGVFCPSSLSRLSNLDSPRSAGLLPQNQTLGTGIFAPCSSVH